MLNGAMVSMCLLASPVVLQAQIDPEQAATYFSEAAELCKREGGRLWGVSLCGPMVFADAATQSIATNQTPPAADKPRILGFVNAPISWGDTHWSTYVWGMIPTDDVQDRGRLMIHELFHRVQGDLGLMTVGPPNDHLDTLEGRTWMQLEWRALARALAATDAERIAAVREALAFRQARRALFTGSSESERADELREGLAQYTGTVVAAGSTKKAIADVVQQLMDAEAEPSFVRRFAYPSGAAYGLLLDAWSPGWTRRITPQDDLGKLLMQAAKIEPAADAEGAALKYGGPELRSAETGRDTKRRARVAKLRQRFVDGPVLVVPRGQGAMLNTTGVTPIPGAGTVFLEYRVTAEWGALESTGILESADGVTLRLPLPFRTDGATLTGEGWSITLSPGWIVRPGQRAGDFEVVFEDECEP